MIDYDILPEHMQRPARLYIEEGLHPGGFLTAVLENRLLEVLSRANDMNIHYFKDWGRWLCQIPMAAKGSEAAVANWIEHKGMSMLGDEKNWDYS